LTLSEVALNLAKSLDALSIKNYDTYYKFITKILRINSENPLVYNNLVEAIATILYLTTDRPGIRPEDKERYSYQYLNLMDEVVNQYINTLVGINTVLTMKNEYLTILYFKGEKSQFNSFFGDGSKIYVPSERAVVDVPLSSLPGAVILNMVLMQWNTNPVSTDSRLSTIGLTFRIWPFGGYDIIDPIFYQVYL
jgi:hypothetical protein